MTAHPMRHIILSGCSGGGKSTLLAELARRGFVVVPEPGRRMVEEELRSAGVALPWIDLAAFARRAIALARQDRERFANAPLAFFDRSLIDAAAALQHATGEPVTKILKRDEPYHRTVFMLPPWRELYVEDHQRHHTIDDAEAEYQRLLDTYTSLGYTLITVPRMAVTDRVDFILGSLA